MCTATSTSGIGSSENSQRYVRASENRVHLMDIYIFAAPYKKRLLVYSVQLAVHSAPLLDTVIATISQRIRLSKSSSFYYLSLNQDASRSNLDHLKLNSKPARRVILATRFLFNSVFRPLLRRFVLKHLEKLTLHSSRPCIYSAATQQFGVLISYSYFCYIALGSSQHVPTSSWRK